MKKLLSFMLFVILCSGLFGSVSAYDLSSTDNRMIDALEISLEKIFATKPDSYREKIISALDTISRMPSAKARVKSICFDLSTRLVSNMQVNVYGNNNTVTSINNQNSNNSNVNNYYYYYYDQSNSNNAYNSNNSYNNNSNNMNLNSNNTTLNNNSNNIILDTSDSGNADEDNNTNDSDDEEVLNAFLIVEVINDYPSEVSLNGNDVLVAKYRFTAIDGDVEIRKIKFENIGDSFNSVELEMNIEDTIIGRESLHDYMVRFDGYSIDIDKDESVIVEIYGNFHDFNLTNDNYFQLRLIEIDVENKSRDEISVDLYGLEGNRIHIVPVSAVVVFNSINNHLVNGENKIAELSIIVDGSNGEDVYLSDIDISLNEYGVDVTNLRLKKVGGVNVASIGSLLNLGDDGELEPGTTTTFEIIADVVLDYNQQNNVVQLNVNEVIIEDGLGNIVPVQNGGQLSVTVGND